MDSTTQKLINEALTSAAQGALSAKRDAIHELNKGLSQATDRNIDLNGRIGDAQVQNIQLINQMNEVQRALNAEREKTKKLSQQVASYEFLLKKPLAEIAEFNKDFKETYENQIELLADWMVSQKAFKELAIQFGKKLGLSTEEVLNIGSNKEIDVLEDKHDKSHNTNVFDSSIIRPRVDKLKSKWMAAHKV